MPELDSGTTGFDQSVANDIAEAIIELVPSDLTTSQRAAIRSKIGAIAEIADNSLAPAKAQAGNAAQQQAWRTRLAAASTDAVPEVWSTIANGTQINLGKVVTHGGAYFGCITQHSKGSTGPDGDPTNWIILSNWGGTWSAKWYPVGTLVSHAGLPWVSTQAVINTDPAPNASTNTKWLALGTTDPDVVIASSNTSIPASANGNTYIHTGSSNITYTLPAASGGAAVDDGWQIVITNQGAGDLTIDGNGADTVDGRTTLAITTTGRSVKLQKVANGAWVSIADTKDETGGGGSSFTPSKANLYDAVKAILVHNSAVTADDANDELDIATGGAAAISDNSIAPIKAQANTDAQKKAWRDRLNSSNISAGTTLPALANMNVGDVIVLTQDASPISFRELDVSFTQRTDGLAGDVMMVLNVISSDTWVRIGNISIGGATDQTARNAAAAAQTAANAANALSRKITFLSLYVDPGVKVQQAPATRVSAIQGNYRLIISPPDVLTGEDVWIRVFARGRPLHSGRVKVNVSPAPQFTVPFAIDSTTATNINDNDPGGTSIDVEVNFYSSDSDAGLFDVRTIPVDIVQTPRVDDRQPLLPNLGNDQVWISRGRGTVAESIRTIATPVIIVSNIASYDATQNRFEDSSGNEVTVPNGSIVTLTEAVYNAAVADAGFTPNANAIFLTR